MFALVNTKFGQRYEFRRTNELVFALLRYHNVDLGPTNIHVGPDGQRFLKETDELTYWKILVRQRNRNRVVLAWNVVSQVESVSPEYRLSAAMAKFSQLLASAEYD